MQDIACLGLVHGDDPERCYGREVGGGVHVWECMYTRDEFMSMYGKTNTKKMLIIFKRKKKQSLKVKGKKEIEWSQEQSGTKEVLFQWKLLEYFQ